MAIEESYARAFELKTGEYRLTVSRGNGVEWSPHRPTAANPAEQACITAAEIQADGLFAFLSL